MRKPKILSAAPLRRNPCLFAVFPAATFLRVSQSAPVYFQNLLQVWAESPNTR